MAVATKLQKPNDKYLMKIKTKIRNRLFFAALTVVLDKLEKKDAAK